MGGMGGANASLAAMGHQSMGSMDNQLLKSLGLDAQTIHMMQQQELLKQQQLAQQMSMFGMTGGMDQKTLQMLGMSGLDPKLLQSGLDSQTQQLMAQQQAALGLLGGFPAGLDASMMQQILGKAPPAPSKKQNTPKKSYPSTSVSGGIPSSMANLDFLKQQEQLLLLAGGLKPEQLMQSPELQMLAAQVGYNFNPR